MNFKDDKRGMVRVIESFLASLLILSTLALVPSQLGVGSTHYSTLSSEGTQVLVSLDSNGFLSKLIEDGNWTSLTNCLKSMLPVSLWFNVTVFDENMDVLNDVFVSNGSPVSDDMVAVNYVCAASAGTFAVYLVRLQLAEVS
ncbi:MAG: hypothetical protein IAX21_02835 [Candidatus Bathyarchaeota archaeon]|nr:MAG: hypothetical protein NUK63_02735 [Candidatus Bathyarchaeum tardum]WNZ29810.1 MAG: hypothetical protein IAX21_02835 [Candidatus Bathyarchaeota archaeon]